MDNKLEDLLAPSCCGPILALGDIARKLASDLESSGLPLPGEVRAPLGEDWNTHETPENGLARLEETEPGSLAAVLIGCDDVTSLPLGFFNAANARLTASGQVILIAGGNTSAVDEGDVGCRLSYLAAIGQRCGFSAQASVQSMNNVLVPLKKDAYPPRWRLVSVCVEDVEAFKALFERAFGSGMDTELWRWKYAENRGAGVAAYRGDRMVAHYGGTRRRAVWAGGELSLWQICDAMVDPPERGVMTKKGVMFLAAATFMELRFGLERADYAFGFPSRRHEGLGERLALYAEADRVMEVTWPIASPRPRLSTRIRGLDPTDGNSPGLVDALWQQMQDDLQEDILVIRDWDYIRHRYIDHPTHRYDLLWVTSRLTGRHLGLLVLRRLPESLELIDLVGSLQVLPTLIDQARRLAGRWGLPKLFCWITQAKLSLFLGRDAHVRDLDVSMPISVWVPPEGGVDRVRGRWWLMSGDTDFH